MAKQYCRGARASRVVHAIVALATMAEWLSPSASHASDPPRVVMVSDGELPATSERVRAELAAMGFAIVLEERGGAEPTVDALGEVAQGRNAVAAVALTFSPKGIDVWVVEPAKHEARLRRFVSAGDAATEPTLALRAAELLRASLIDVTPGHAPLADAPPAERGDSGPSPAPEPSMKAPAAPMAARPALAPASSPTSSDADPSRAATLRLGAGLVASAGGLGAFPTVDLAAKWWVSEHVGVELGALVPLARMTQRSSEGSSVTRVGVLSLGLAVALPLGQSAWVWDIGASIAGVALQTQGTPSSAAYTRRENIAAAVAPLARSALSYALTPGSRLGLGASLGVSAPRFLIVYADRTVATWGRPFAMGELMLEVDVP
jgi:hypothetical protein